MVHECCNHHQIKPSEEIIINKKKKKERKEKEIEYVILSRLAPTVYGRRNCPPKFFYTSVWRRCWRFAPRSPKVNYWQRLSNPLLKGQNRILNPDETMSYGGKLLRRAGQGMVQRPLPLFDEGPSLLIRDSSQQQRR